MKQSINLWDHESNIQWHSNQQHNQNNNGAIYEYTFDLWTQECGCNDNLRLILNGSKWNIDAFTYICQDDVVENIQNHVCMDHETIMHAFSPLYFRKKKKMFY